MKNRIVISEEWDSYYNVAAEYSLMKEASEGVTLFLWQNEPSVFIGRNQNLYAESNLEYLKKNGICPVRRFSGGGAVYQDRGNLNFSFVCPAEGADMERMKKTVKEAMEASEISCTFSGRNDLLSQGRKFSGHAFYEEDGRLLYHGTLLFDVNLEHLEKSLSPSKEKLKSKGIASVRSRVVNLKEISPGLTLERLKNTLAEAFYREYGGAAEVQDVNGSEFKLETVTEGKSGFWLKKINRRDYPVSEELYTQLKSREWIYGQAPKWSISLEKRLSFGLVSVSLNVKDGRIAEIKIYTDSLLTLDFSECEKKLTESWFDEQEVFDAIEKNVLQ